MTTHFDNRRGSALLVVLGMLAFMLFSGLAFSVYMRQSRLPTSFLRRTTTTRQLAKAALAEAIEDIDRGIGNDPHPGIRVQGYSEGEAGNFWSHRVFIREGTTSQDENHKNQTDTSTYYPDYASPEDTVATLTLEGLAYLPPNLINEVRYYSQRTPTAKWQSFWFDSGRYAYTAVDVSDYFDVNRILADYPRAACGSRRITLAHLFEEGADHSSAGSGADKWESFMEGYRKVDDSNDSITYGQYPFISLADFNIAWGSRDIGVPTCPFHSFINTPSGEPYKELGDSKEDPQAEKYRNMTFVTDGWFPAPKDNKTKEYNYDKIDLCGAQPFTASEMSSKQPKGLKSVFQSSGGEVLDRLEKHICQLGIAQLWDYLDEDRVPVSLAIPTLERTPMIVGIEPLGLPTVKFATTCPAKDTYDNNAPTDWKTRTAKRTYTCKMTLNGQAAANILAAYPFRKHGIEESDDSFKIDGRMAVFFTVDGENMSLRPGSSNASLHMTKDGVTKESNLSDDKTVFTFKLSQQSIRASTIAQDESKPVKKIEGIRGDAKGIGEVEFFKITYQWKQTEQVDADGNGTGKPNEPDPDLTDVSQISQNSAETVVTVCPLKANGDKADEFNNVATFAQKMASGGIAIKANAAIWVRVTDANDKTVDLVPACLFDDEELNRVNSDAKALTRIFGEAYPLMRYDVQIDGQPNLTVNCELNKDPCALTIASPKTLVSDPRFNHAPENWYTTGGSDLTETDWLDAASSLLGGEHDSDFYMFTSDQGYMQSVYELAFLPRFTTLAQRDWSTGGLYSPNFSSRTTIGNQGEVMDRDWMWKTYRCFDGEEADYFDKIGLVCGDSGLKVNPYSDSLQVLMAAFANTPHDWRVASTNNDEVVDMKATDFNKKHAWNDYSTDQTGRLCWDSLQDVADAFQSRVRSENGDWESAFENLGCWNNSKKLIESSEEGGTSDDSDLYGVDKKFLYGFWRDSFAARQQLFLIFVRAEPMMMGGGVTGQAPPQLGARAVALVWRDPAETQTSSDSTDSSVTRFNPHRTRILFYHQFD